jgi:hypothetical protein
MYTYIDLIQSNTEIIHNLLYATASFMFNYHAKNRILFLALRFRYKIVRYHNDIILM